MLRFPSVLTALISTLGVPALSAAQDIWAAPDPNAPSAAPTTPAPSATPPAAAPTSAPPTPAAKPPAARPSTSKVAASYTEMDLAGVRKIVIRDFDGAIAQLRAAAEKEPARPEAFCHLGDAQLEKSDLSEARIAFQSCARFAQASRDDHFLAVALAGEARVLGLEGKPKEEREAWQKLATVVSDEPGRALGQGRVKALDAVLALDADYEAVRRRSADRKAQAEPAPTR
jgi:tetratricopeptide (TPR) repeat protein